MKRETVLLINAEGVQTLCMARSLRRLGFRVIGFCNNRCSSGYFTRHLSKRYKSPDITLSQPQFRDFLFRYLKENEVNLIIPLADDGARFLSEHKEKIEKEFKTICAVPSFEIFDLASDKQKLMALCEKMGVKHPRTRGLTLDNLNEVAEYVGFPAMIKPNLSQGAKGIVKVNNIYELTEKAPRILSQFGMCTLQQFIEQPGHYYNVMLFRDSKGTITGSTVIKIRRFFPLKGGSSCYCETIDMPELVNQCLCVLEEMDWHGFADFDVLEDVYSGTTNIIEINPRVPSSFQAAFAAGVDFGKCFVSEYLYHINTFFDYKEGQQIRWMGLDVMWFLFSRERFHFKPSWFRFFGSNLSYQDGSWSDPCPMISGIFAGLVKYLNPSFRKAKLNK